MLKKKEVKKKEVKVDVKDEFIKIIEKHLKSNEVLKEVLINEVKRLK